MCSVLTYSSFIEDAILSAFARTVFTSAEIYIFPCSTPEPVTPGREETACFTSKAS